jgi:hypothetical protein
MKRNLVFRIGAVATSALLASAYVYDRSGGNLLPRFGFGSPPAVSTEADGIDAAAGTVTNAPAHLYSSKSGVVFPAPNAAANSEATQLMPGSKSLILIDPSERATPIVLPGSKSDAVFRPQPSAPPENESVTEESEPQEAAPPPPPTTNANPRAVLGGSKSKAVFEPPTNNRGNQRPAPRQQAAPR